MLRFDRVWLAGAVSLGFCLGVLPVASIASAQETLSQSDRNVLVKGATDNDYIASNSAQDPHGVRVCDLNGDGYGDLVVGAPRYSSYGRVYVVFGEEELWDSSFDLLSDADFTVTGSSTSRDISGSLACGDIDGDGVEDLVIGAPGANSSAGAVYVVFGSASLSGDLDLASESADVTVIGVAGGTGELGRDVVVADFNDDGFGDLVLGNPGADPDPDGLGPRADAGMVHVLFGSATPATSVDLATSAADVTIHGVSENGVHPPANIGQRVDAGDFNGDGIEDIVFGNFH
ncbi:MAG: FG-GAP-like repeat-containing protein, partial [Myxococcota bacterium]